MEQLLIPECLDTIMLVVGESSAREGSGEALPQTLRETLPRHSLCCCQNFTETTQTSLWALGAGAASLLSFRAIDIGAGERTEFLLRMQPTRDPSRP